MTKTWIAALAFALLAAPAGAEEKAVKEKTSAVESVARFSAPAGWIVERREGDDPSVRISRSGRIIMIRLFGGEGSDYAQPVDYLAGPGASTMGRPPEKDKPATVAGVKTRLYRRGYPVRLGDPHRRGAGPPELAREMFCVVPAGRRFLVLSYADENPMPDASGEGEKAWRAFLQSFQLKRGAGPGKKAGP